VTLPSYPSHTVSCEFGAMARMHSPLTLWHRMFWGAVLLLAAGQQSRGARAESPALSSSFPAAAVGPAIVGADGFWRSPTVLRDMERFTATCKPLVGKVLDKWLAMYESNARVLTVEAACLTGFQNGLGNILGDFLAWFVWGVVTNRAVYIRWTDCPDEVGLNNLTGEGDGGGGGGDAGGAGGRAPKCGGGRGEGRGGGGGGGGEGAGGDGGAGGEPVACRARANLAQYLQMPGGRDWGLTPAVWRRISAATRGGGPTVSTAAPGDFPDGPEGLFGKSPVDRDGRQFDSGSGGGSGILWGQFPWVEAGASIRRSPLYPSRYDPIFPPVE